MIFKNYFHIIDSVTLDEPSSTSYIGINFNYLAIFIELLVLLPSFIFDFGTFTNKSLHLKRFLKLLYILPLSETSELCAEHMKS